MGAEKTWCGGMDLRLVQGMYANARSCIRVGEGYSEEYEGLDTQPAALHHSA